MTNQFPTATPETRDVLDRIKENTSKDINCHLIGRIEAIQLDKNTVSVSSAFKRKMPNGTEQDYPLFVDVPLFILCGGGSFLWVPVKAGDWCILEFNDRDIDSWWYSGEVRIPNSPRIHSLSDGMAIVGIRPASDVLTLLSDTLILNALANKISIKNNDCEVTFDNGIQLDAKAKKLKIKNTAQNIKAILEAMLDAIIGATGTITGTSVSGGAVTGTCAITADSNIATVKSLIAQLVE